MMQEALSYVPPSQPSRENRPRGLVVIMWRMAAKGLGAQQLVAEAPSLPRAGSGIAFPCSRQLRHQHTLALAQQPTRHTLRP